MLLCARFWFCKEMHKNTVKRMPNLPARRKLGSWPFAHLLLEAYKIGQYLFDLLKGYLEQITFIFYGRF